MASAKIVGSFRINTTGNRTTNEVIAAGNYDWKHDMVNGENFPMRPIPEGTREIVLLQFDHESTFKEAITEATMQGLEQPRYEDALLFGEQYPKEQRNAPIVFLHEPWQRLLFDYMGVLVLGFGVRHRSLLLNYFCDSFERQCRFAFIKPQSISVGCKPLAMRGALFMVCSAVRSYS